MYVLEPGETIRVESATADPIGLKVGICYDYEAEVCITHRIFLRPTNHFPL